MNFNKLKSNRISEMTRKAIDSRMSLIPDEITGIVG